MIIYLIGSMRNEKIPSIAIELRKHGYEVFDDWFAPGPEADLYWQNYAKQRGQTYQEALYDHHAQHVFAFDKYHLDRADCAVLVMPAGRSGHMELGYMVGKGKPAFVLFEEEPDRYDVMYQLATAVTFSIDDLLHYLDAEKENDRHMRTVGR
jgi:nucleoside 2-deoxyribosyltransferase